MSNLYHFEMIFLIQIDMLKNADKKTVKKMNKRINKFKVKAIELLDIYAVPTGAKAPIPFTQAVGYGEDILEDSNLIHEIEELQNKCIDDNIYPILLSGKAQDIVHPKKLRTSVTSYSKFWLRTSCTIYLKSDLKAE